MEAGLILILITLIICGSIIYGTYMCLCSQNKVKMFSDPQYEERIRKLEKIVKELREK